MTLHKSIPLAGRHAPHSFEYADAAARAAAGGLTAADVGKTARQLDDNSTWMLTNHVGPVWRVVGVSDHGALTGLGDDDHPQYALRAYAVVPVVATPRVITAADADKILVWLGTGAVTFTLPAAAAVGAGFRVRVQNKGFFPPAAVVTINRAGADTFSLGTSNSGTSLVSGTNGDNSASIELISNGVSSWQAALGDGTWTDGIITRHFDAHIPGGTTGRFVSIDANDDLQDSGYSAASFEVPLTFGDSLNRAVNTVTLDNDSASPGNGYYYGTDTSGTKGWYQLPAGGDGGGSDMAIYSNIAGDFSVAFKDADELAIFGLPWSLSAVQIKRITRKPTGANVSVIRNRGTDLVCTWTPDALITLAGVITTTSLGTLLSTDEYIIEIDGPPKGYHAATDSAKSMVTNAMHYVNDGLVAEPAGEIAEVILPLLATGYNAFSMNVELGTVGDNVTVMGTNAPGMSVFHDITALALGVPVVNASGAYQTTEPLMWQYIKLIVDGTVSSAAVHLTRFRK